MEEKKEVFLGQKGSIACYNLEKTEVIWSSKVIGTPSLISTYRDYLIIQGLNKWGTRFMQHCLEASSGKLLWYSEEFKNIIVPYFIDNDMFFLDSKIQICKVSLTKGQVYFRKKFAGAFKKYSYLLTVSGKDVYLLSKNRSLQVNKEDGSTSEIKELSNFSKKKITAACGNNLDQISNISSLLASQSSGTAYIATNGGGEGS